MKLDIAPPLLLQYLDQAQEAGILKQVQGHAEAIHPRSGNNRNMNVTSSLIMYHLPILPQGKYMHPLTANPPQRCRWHRFHTTAGLEQSAVQAILQAAQEAIQLRGVFHIVLAGGTTPRHIYAMLRKTSADWKAWQVYFGDERCLPASDPDRNSSMAAQEWLDHVMIPPAQIHPIPVEQGAEKAARAYAQTLAGTVLFDLVLLGLGEDGHTASLFPGHELGDTDDAPAVLAVDNAPKPPPQRISLSARRLSAARRVLFMVSGTAKKKAARDWYRGVAIPATAIRPANGVDVYIDTALL